MAETSEETARLVSDIACSHGLSKVEDWRWIKEGGCPSIGTLEADGRRLVARLFDDGSALARADSMARLAHHLDSTGVDVEQVVPAASGEPVTLLPGGAPVILSLFYPDPTMAVPFDAEDAREWGRYVARLHDACRDWRTPSPVPSPWLHPDPKTVLDRSCTLAGPFRGPRGILDAASGRIAGCWAGALESRPVHGDLWPGNLLRGPRGLRAIDFAEAGDGPRTIDMATAFSWMPWRDDPEGAALAWGAWLSGYGEVGTISRAELESIPPLACLQHLILMNAEVGTSTGAAESSWYVEDHCSAVQALLFSAKP